MKPDTTVSGGLPFHASPPNNVSDRGIVPHPDLEGSPLPPSTSAGQAPTCSTRMGTASRRTPTEDLPKGSRNKGGSSPLSGPEGYPPSPHTTKRGDPSCPPRSEGTGIKRCRYSFYFLFLLRYAAELSSTTGIALLDAPNRCGVFSIAIPLPIEKDDHESLPGLSCESAENA
jgi:hypothetical protein